MRWSACSQAASASGIKRVMLPARNRKDLEEVPAEAKEKIEFVFLEDVDEAVRVALEPRSETASSERRQTA